MAQRRMLSKKITETDAFLDMPVSAQALYFHLNMNADDDGFVDAPKKVMRNIGASDDDYKLLIAKRFIIIFESGVCVIKHWLIHNLIRQDRYNETNYLDEKNSLKVKKNKAYTQNVIPDDNQRLPQVRLGKDRKGKEREETSEPSSQEHKTIVEIIDLFSEVNPTAYSRWYANKTQRQAIKDLLKARDEDIIKNTIALLHKVNGKQYFPTITTPCQLRDKWSSLEAAFKRLQESSKPKEQIF